MTIKRQLQVTAVGIIFLLSLTYSVYETVSLQKESVDIVNREADLQWTQFNQYLTEYFAKGKIFVYTLLNDDEVIKAFEERDREKLKDLTYPLYKAYHDDFKFYQIHFHLPPATSFLRLHKLTKYGDDLKDIRLTIVDANKNKKDVKGLEVGAFGVGMRYVTPVFSLNGEHIGALEAGGSLDSNAVKYFMEITENSRNMYDMEMSAVFRLVDGNLALIGSTFENEVDSFGEEIINELKDHPKVIRNDKGFIYDAYFPLVDYQDQLMGYVKFEIDYSEYFIAIRNQIYFVTGMLLIVTLVVLILVTLIVNNVLTKKIKIFTDIFFQGATGNLTVTYPQKTKLNCSEEMNCGKTDCPLYGKTGSRCWYEVGSDAPAFGNEVKCPSILSGKYKSCQQCPVYKKTNNNEIEVLGTTLNQFVKELRKTISFTKQLSVEINKATDQLSASSEELSATSENIYEKTKYNAENSTQIKENVQKVLTETEKGQEVLNQADEWMNDIQSGAGEIQKIMKVIEEIAFQTNILALNASVEAARAGEHGAGFAIVADQVKQLANKSSSNSSDINQRVDKITNLIKEESRIVDQSSEQFKLIQNLINSLSAMNQQLDTDTQEQKKQINQMHQGIQSVSSSSVEISTQMEELSKQLGYFKTDKNYDHQNQKWLN